MMRFILYVVAVFCSMDALCAAQASREITQRWPEAIAWWKNLKKNSEMARTLLGDKLPEILEKRNDYAQLIHARSILNASNEVDHKMAKLIIDGLIWEDINRSRARGFRDPAEKKKG